MIKEEGYMDPTTPTEFVDRTSEAIEHDRLANRRIQPNGKVALPFVVQNPLDSVEVCRVSQIITISQAANQLLSNLDGPLD